MAIDFIKNPTEAQKKPRGYNFWKPGMPVENKPGLRDIRQDVESMRNQEFAAHPERNPSSLPRVEQPLSMKSALEGKPKKDR